VSKSPGLLTLFRDWYLLPVQVQTPSSFEHNRAVPEHWLRRLIPQSCLFYRSFHLSKTLHSNGIVVLADLAVITVQDCVSYMHRPLAFSAN
jgi:hypothetical protein